MTNEQAVNQNVSFYPTDLVILDAVQKRNGQTLSGAVRFIIREWARSSGLQDTLGNEAIPTTKTRTIKPSARKRIKARKFKPEAIPGVRKGLVS